MVESRGKTDQENNSVGLNQDIRHIKSVGLNEEVGQVKGVGLNQEVRQVKKTRVLG